MNGDFRTLVDLYPDASCAVKVEEHKMSVGRRLFELHRNMIGNPDPTRAQVFGVKIKEIKLDKKETAMKFCSITTWVKLLDGETPTHGCLTVTQAQQLSEWVLTNATWINKGHPRNNLHGDLHRDNIRVYCDNGQLTLKAFDFGNGVRDWECPGDTSAFDKDLAQYVRTSSSSVALFF